MKKFLFLFLSLATLSSAKTFAMFEKPLSYNEVVELTKKLFQELAGGDTQWALNFLKKRPYWASIRSSTTGNTPILVAMKNYSGAKIEKELITLLITSAPDMLLLPNDNGATIYNVIESFGPLLKKELLILLKETLANIEIDKTLSQKAYLFLTEKQYKRFTALFYDNPHLIYFVDDTKKTLLEYCQEADGTLNQVGQWILYLTQF